MAQKFHINAKGVPSPCRATKGNCPFGGADGTENHFDSYDEAQSAADELMSAEYGILYQEEAEQAGEEGWKHEDLRDGTLKVAAQVRLDLEDNGDLNDEGVSIAGDVTREYSSYLRKTNEENPKSLYEFYEAGLSGADKPSKESHYEEVYDYHDGPVGARWTGASQASFDEESEEYEDAHETASMIIEDLEVYSKRMENTDWSERGLSKNEAMSEMYDYVSEVYDNH